MNRIKLPLNEIVIENRQRLDLGDIQDLADSLSRLGLIQPVIINQHKRLIAGGRRCAAATKLGWTDIDVVYRETLSEDELAVLELEENIRRKDQTWQEKCLHVAHIHYLKVSLAAKDSKTWAQRATGEMLNMSVGSVNTTLLIARKLKAELANGGKRRYWECENFLSALSLATRDEIDEMTALLAEKQRAATVEGQKEDDELLELTKVLAGNDESTDMVITSGVLSNYDIAKERYLSNKLNDPAKFDEYWASRQRLLAAKDNTVYISNRLILGDSIDYMNHPDNAGRFDHVVTDIPYGIDMDMLNQQNPHGGMKNIDTVEVLHDVEYNRDLIKNFFPAAFKATKDKSFVVTWGDFMLWQFMYDCAIEAGFKVQRWPIVWVKTHRCMNQAIAFNTTKTIELAIVCRKPGATLAWQPDTSVIECGRDELCDMLDHPFAKPFLCWERLVNIVSIEGQTILEPFAGRGSGVLSMLKMNRNVIAVERDEAHYNSLLENVKVHHYLKLNPDFVFK